MPRLTRSIAEGYKRRKVAGSTATLAFLGSYWLLTEIVGFIFSDANKLIANNTAIYGAIAIFGGILAFIVRIYEPLHISFKVPTTGTKITLKFGDLFEEDCDIVVAVNEYFDGEIGQKVSPNSVHGQLLQRRFFRSAFEEAVATQLTDAPNRKTSRICKPDLAYPIGTSLVLPLGSQYVYLFALTHSDQQTHKASVELAEAVDAIRAVLVQIHQTGSGRPVAFPLVGNGQSGLNLPPQHLLRLLVLLIVSVARTLGLPKDVRVCLHDACFEELDLREIARDWRN